MPRLRYKSFATPDEVRPIPRGLAAVVSLDEVTVARAEFGPGWRWSNDLATIMGTRSCQVHHLGHACPASCMSEWTMARLSTYPRTRSTRSRRATVRGG